MCCREDVDEFITRMSEAGKVEQGQRRLGAPTRTQATPSPLRRLVVGRDGVGGEDRGQLAFDAF